MVARFVSGAGRRLVRTPGQGGHVNILFHLDALAMNESN
jgi:hypothetical protein